MVASTTTTPLSTIPGSSQSGSAPTSPTKPTGHSRHPKPVNHGHGKASKPKTHVVSHSGRALIAQHSGLRTDHRNLRGSI
jgi:hypothetical protein